MPKKGRAVLWPSVYSAQPMNEDSRMMHQALPVIAGTKFGANAWVHMCVSIHNSVNRTNLSLPSFVYNFALAIIVS